MIKKLDLEYRIDEYDLAYKLNEVIDELNELVVCKVDKKPAPWPPESAKRTITTPPGKELHMKNNGSKDLVLVVEQGDFVLPGALIPAKKEEKLYLTAEGMRAYDGSKWV